MMRSVEELREELRGLEARKDQIVNVDKRIHETKERIHVAESIARKEYEDCVREEAKIMKKAALAECKPFFECPKCGKRVPVRLCKSVLVGSERKVVLEGVCPNPKCENKLEYGENSYLKDMVLFALFSDRIDVPSVYKKIVLGHY